MVKMISLLRLVMFLSLVWVLIIAPMGRSDLTEGWCAGRRAAVLENLCRAKASDLQNLCDSTEKRSRVCVADEATKK